MCRSIRFEEETTLAAGADNGASNLGARAAVPINALGLVELGQVVAGATASGRSAPAPPSEPMAAIAVQRRIASDGAIAGDSDIDRRRRSRQVARTGNRCQPGPR